MIRTDSYRIPKFEDRQFQICLDIYSPLDTTGYHSAYSVSYNQFAFSLDMADRERKEWSLRHLKPLRRPLISPIARLPAIGTIRGKMISAPLGTEACRLLLSSRLGRLCNESTRESRLPSEEEPAGSTRIIALPFL